MLSKDRKRFVLPHTVAVLFFIVVFAAILTWFIPAGEYEYETVDGITKVVAGTYHTVEKSGQGLWAVILSIITGFSNASIMMTLVFFVGAAIYILEQTGSIDRAFRKLAGGGAKNKNSIIIFSIMLFMTIGGATGVFATPTIALIPIGIILSELLNLDKATGFFIVYFGAFSGFNVGWASTPTLGIAHPLAELPTFSGWKVRLLFHVVNFILHYYFIMKYVKMIEKDPSKSLSSDYDPKRLRSSNDENNSGGLGGSEELQVKDIVNFVATFGALVSVMVGSIAFGWAIKEIAAPFLILSIFLGLYNGYGVDGTTKMLIKGASTVIGAAFTIGVATAISVILEDGNILNTIIYALSFPMGKVGAIGSTIIMFFANFFINLFIPSGSGQAAAVMPIMVPIADLSGITRQVAVQAFQFGDGLSNVITPASSALMAGLGMAKIDLSKYMKWYTPLLIILIILATIALVILQTIGWTGL